MRLIISISLLGLLLFNMLGHYPVYLGLQYQARQDMERRLDHQDIEGQELFAVKIPINLPYWQNMQDYERVNGRFQHNGEFYTLFKQKIENDTLHLVCVKDRQEQKLFNKITEFVKITFGDSPGTHQKAGKFLESLIKDYLPLEQRVIAFLYIWVEPSSQPTHKTYTYSDVFLSPHAPPPQV